MGKPDFPQNQREKGIEKHLTGSPRMPHQLYEGPR
jgi:hypothetical protein